MKYKTSSFCVEQLIYLPLRKITPLFREVWWNLYPCLGIFFFKTDPCFRELLLKNDPWERHIPSVASIGSAPPPGDDSLKMSSQVNAITKRCHFHLHNIRAIRKSLTKTATEQLIHAFVTSTLDNCNALLCGVPSCLVDQLQRLQNSAARVVTLKRKHDSMISITPVLKELHWLPIRSRVQFKVLILAWRALNGIGPSYIKDLLSWYDPSRMLRSTANLQLTVPQTRLSTYGDRAFSVVAPKLWNNLPVHLKTSKTLDEFKKKLKTHLFGLAFQ